jgi:hypothetical protein
LSGIKGLETVSFREGNESGLALLRSSLQDVGLRDLERQATYAIERRRTSFMLGMTSSKKDGGGINRLVDEWGPWWNRFKPDFLDFSLGFSRRWFVEATTGYGLYPIRALYMWLLALWVLAAIFYTFVIGCKRRAAGRHWGIYRIFPPDRIDLGVPPPRIAGDQPVERLVGRGFWRSLGWGIWFSTLTTFHFGWRDLNVGVWLSRLQRGEYVLRAVGSVRVVSGFQSIMSLYLIVIWALTYFGRPFQ